MTPTVETSLTCRRASARKGIVRPSTLRIDAAGPLDMMVEDLSVTGFRFASAVPIAVGTPIRVGLAGSGQADAQVTWREGLTHGSVFTPALDQATLDAAFSHDQTGGVAIIAPRSRTALLAIQAVHDVRVESTSQADRRLTPFGGFLLTMLAGGLSWKLLAMLLG